MRRLKQLLSLIPKAIRSVINLPHNITIRWRVMGRRIDQERAEAERLDRLRHPEKYLGK